MEYDVYCDESRPDLIYSKTPEACYLLIGSLWVPTSLRSTLKSEVHALRDTHRIGGEFKWNKVSSSKLGFYLDLIDLFFSYRTQLRFRSILVNAWKYKSSYNDGDNELGFYKFYYQLLFHWLVLGDSHYVFCDIIKYKHKYRLSDLSRCLGVIDSIFRDVFIQYVPSKQSILIQMADVLLGAVSSRMNETIQPGSSKAILVDRIEQHLGHTIRPTPQSESKFNVFRIRLSD